MSTSGRRTRRRTAVLAVLLGFSGASWSCAGESREQADLVEQEVPGEDTTVLVVFDSVQPGAPESAPAGEVPNRAAAAPPVAPPAQQAENRPRLSPSQELKARMASRPVARVVQGVAQIQMGPQLVPADYLRVVLGGSRPQQEALTSASGEFFFKDVPVGSYTLWFSTVGKAEQQVLSQNIQVAGGELVRIGPFRIPLDAVRVRR